MYMKSEERPRQGVHYDRNGIRVVMRHHGNDGAKRSDGKGIEVICMNWRELLVEATMLAMMIVQHENEETDPEMSKTNAITGAGKVLDVAAGLFAPTLDE